jgi:hypothetical protein
VNFVERVEQPGQLKVVAVPRPQRHELPARRQLPAGQDEFLNPSPMLGKVLPVCPGGPVNAGLPLGDGFVCKAFHAVSVRCQ